MAKTKISPFWINQTIQIVRSTYPVVCQHVLLVLLFLTPRRLWGRGWSGKRDTREKALSRRGCWERGSDSIFFAFLSKAWMLSGFVYHVTVMAVRIITWKFIYHWNNFLVQSNFVYTIVLEKNTCKWRRHLYISTGCEFHQQSCKRWLNFVIPVQDDVTRFPWSDRLQDECYHRVVPLLRIPWTKCPVLHTGEVIFFSFMHKCSYNVAKNFMYNSCIEIHECSTCTCHSSSCQG